MLSFSISYPNLIKFAYFANLIQRGDNVPKEVQKQGEDKVTLKKFYIKLFQTIFS
jgi:hypothetical protein